MSSDAAFWDGIAEKYARDPIKDEAAYEASLDRVRHWLRPDWDVLEIGCGTGNTAVKLAPSVQGYTGTDLSPAMIRIAEHRLEAADIPGLRFASAGADAATAEGRFDAVLAFNLLHLVPDRMAVLRQVRGQLAVGGVFISKTPCLAGKLWLRPLIWGLRLIGKAPGVVSLVSPSGLQEEITSAGFEIVETGFYPNTPMGCFLVARAV